MLTSDTEYKDIENNRQSKPNTVSLIHVLSRKEKWLVIDIFYGSLLIYCTCIIRCIICCQMHNVAKLCSTCRAIHL